MVRKKWQAREIILGMAVAAALVFILTFYVWYQTEAVRLGREIRNCEDRIRLLKEDIQKLEIRKAALLSPQRVDQIARGSLGMQEPVDRDVIYEGQGTGR